MKEHQLRFMELALARGALRFGRFTLKSGRDSPYFFNAGRFDDGAALAVLGECYAAALARSGIECDMLFGPAYKGIPFVTATAIALAQAHGRSLPWSFNRKEAKDHGEGGHIVGRALAGRVVIVDDVITAGTAIRESVELITAAGATPVAVLLALDRQERGQGERSAVQEVEDEFGLRCISILNLGGLIDALGKRPGREADQGVGHGVGQAAGQGLGQGVGDPVRISAEELASLRAYRDRYGVA